jgi:hypothetical protein
MFGSLSKLAEKSFILGFFLPALIGTIGFVALNGDVPPFSKLLSATLEDDKVAKLTLLLFGVWTIAVVLMTGNHWLYRMLEGYTWPLAQPHRGTLCENEKEGVFLSLQVKRRKNKLEIVKIAWDRFQEAEKALATAKTKGDTQTCKDCERDCAKRKSEYLKLGRVFLLEYPEKRDLVLPTRFGNVLRAFERYPWTAYGVDSIHVWPRLLGVVPKDYQTVLADSRSPVDFFVSLVSISLTLGAAAFVRAGILIYQNASSSDILRFVGAGVLACGLANLFYRAAVAAAVMWGEVVKSAFDLYLPALAKMLGYVLPETLEERRQFWGEVNQQIQFFEPMRPEKWTKSSADEKGDASTENKGTPGDKTPEKGGENSDDDENEE